MYIQKNEVSSGIQELTFTEINIILGGKGKVTIKPTGGIPPTGGEVTFKKPLGGTGGGSQKEAPRNFKDEAEELRKKNDRNSGKKAPSLS